AGVERHHRCGEPSWGEVPDRWGDYFFLGANLAASAFEVSSRGEVGPDRHLFPRVEGPAQRVELLARHPQRFLAEEQVERRVRRFDRLDDRVRRADGVARLLATEVSQRAALGAGGRIVIGDRAGGTILRGTPGPLGAEAARLDERHPD